MPTFDFSKPLFFGDQYNKKTERERANASSLFNLSLGVDPSLRFKDMLFYCGQHPSRRPECCFNHTVGLPRKNDQELPIFDYELGLLRDLEAGQKYLCIKKARGIGITEFFLRYMTWLALCRNYIYRGSKFFVVCGPREQTAVDLIKRIKAILQPLGVLQETERTVASFLDVDIQCFPSSHVSTMRGYTNAKFIFIDEASFWSGKEQEEVRAVAEGYIAKSQPTISMVSTPNVPGTMFEKLFAESETTCLYKRYQFPYTVGLNKIFTVEEIEKARLSPNFEREYNLKYGYGVGNLFEDKDIESILVDNVEEYDKYKLKMSAVAIGCDPGFGSSMASYVVTAQIGNKIVVLDADSFERTSFRWFSNLIYDKYWKYHASKIFIDASARDVVDDLKIAFREETNYEYVKREARINYAYDQDAWMQRMIVVPVPFNKYGDKMLNQLVGIINRQDMSIPRKFENLILDLRMAKENNGKLDKSENKMDLLDALRLACLMYHYE
jgi:hypothetical protein